MSTANLLFVLLVASLSCFARSSVAQPIGSPAEAAVATAGHPKPDEGFASEPPHAHTSSSPTTVDSAPQSAATPVAASAQPPLPATADKHQPHPALGYQTRTITERHWYGGETLLCDAAAATLLLVAAGAESGELAFGSVGVYVLGGPAVHLAHGNIGTSVGSLGLRLALPLGGGKLMSEGKNGWDALGAALVGAGVGALAAIALDSALLAREEVEVQKVVLVPTLSLTHNGASVGMAGVF